MESSLRHAIVVSFVLAWSHSWKCGAKQSMFSSPGLVRRASALAETKPKNTKMSSTASDLQWSQHVRPANPLMPELVKRWAQTGQAGSRFRAMRHSSSSSAAAAGLIGRLLERVARRAHQGVARSTERKQTYAGWYLLPVHSWPAVICWRPGHWYPGPTATSVSSD